MNQGYAYKVITKLAGMETDTDLLYKNHDERVLILQQVMAATDADADEEMIAGIPGTSGGTKRRAGNMASMLDNLYTEFKKSIELITKFLDENTTYIAEDIVDVYKELATAYENIGGAQ